ncbi:MAG: hypothetical protein ACYS0G_04150 [Planctomycetota bacterium]|jgi:hypothetical protein
MTRKIIVGGVGLFAMATAAQGQVQFFQDPVLFQSALGAAGKVSKGRWDLQNNAGPSAILGFTSPLNNLNPGPYDPGFMLDNLTFQSNLNPFGAGGPNPRGVNDMVLVNGPGFGLNNNAVLANYFVDSFDIISGPPAGDNHTAIGMDVISLLPGGAPIAVTVYDKNENQVGQILIPGIDQKQFVGILMDPGLTIGRVNLYDTTGGNVGAEGITYVEAYIPGPGSLALLGLAGLIRRRRRR